MAFEQDLVAKAAANGALAVTVNGKHAEYSTKMAQSLSQINNTIYPARNKAPYYRLTKNQLLTGTSGSVPTGWSTHPDCTFTLVQSVVETTEWNDRTEDERELLTLMGRTGEKNYFDTFNIWRMDWVDSDIDNYSYTMYQGVNGSTAVSVAAFTKILSGDIVGYWADGATNQWKLTGNYYGFNKHRYHHIHAHRQTPIGSVLIALPAAITGFINFDPKTWGQFPYIGETQND